MDDQGDDWGDTLAGFDIGDLTRSQREVLSADLADAGILHAFVGPELQGPAAETEHIEHLVAQTRRGGRRRGVPASVPGEVTAAPRAVRLPWGGVPLEAMALPLSARWRRFAAYLMESLAFGLVTAVIARASVGGAQVFVLASSLVSAVLLVAAFGGTAGMLVLRMRVVLLDAPEQATPGWRVALVRYLVAWWPQVLVFALMPFVAYEQLTWLSTVSDIWIAVCFGPILLDPAHRGLHDRVVGTVVVDVPRYPAASAHPG
ncbi:MAG: hypothetical protein JWO77_3101 [Ilumatobacteraceae bacterium]|nr:hypothetical protein [Ilumatobacteraceae bacterium]